MPDHHTVLSELLKHVPPARFEELIKRYDADGGSRCLDSKSQLVALLYGQLSGAAGLRAIFTCSSGCANTISSPARAPT